MQFFLPVKLIKETFSLGANFCMLINSSRAVFVWWGRGMEQEIRNPVVMAQLETKEKRLAEGSRGKREPQVLHTTFTVS